MVDADSPKRRALSRVISPRELRLLFWLIVIVLVGVIGVLGSGIADTLSGPAVILFVAWLMAYVLEPAVTWLTRHLPFHSRGLSVAATYLATVVVTFAVLLGAGAALLNAAMTFVERLPEIAARVRELVEPLATSLGLSPPAPIDLADAIASLVTENGEAIGDAAAAARAERVRGRCRALHRRGDLGGDGRRRGDLARLAPAIPARTILRGHRCPRASHRPFVWWVHPRPRPDRADLRRPHLDRGLPPGCPLRAAHRGHRGSAPVHPVHRAAVRMGRPAGLRPGPGARGGGSGAGHQPPDRCSHAADRDSHGDGPGGQDQRGRGPGRRHARGGDRRGHGRDLRDPDRRRDPGHHRLPAQAGRPVAPRDRRSHRRRRSRRSARGHERLTWAACWTSTRRRSGCCGSGRAGRSRC